MKTILITGCSSGFGLETAKLFLDQGWQVIATMRQPDAGLLPSSPHLRVVALDVTDPVGIAEVVAAAGPVDVLVNNAGIGVLGAVEGMSDALIQQVFATNTCGTIAMTRAMLPHFREKGAGVIINVTSSVTLLPLPLLAVYTASKAAVNAFTESMALELQHFGLRTHLVLPGRSPETKFGDNARTRMAGTIPDAYSDLAQAIFAGWAVPGPVTTPQEVSAAIWRAATDPTCPLRVLAGADAEALAA